MLPITPGTHEQQSAQWESNPHFRHGKAVGCRYIMGAELHHNQILKDQLALPLKKSTEPESNPHYLVTTEASFP